MMKNLPPLLIFALSLLCACGSPEKGKESPAKAPALSGRPALEADLRAARDAYKADPTEENGIWVGRRMAYLGDYDQAVKWFTKELDRHPDSVALLRHRGHRYLTVRRFEDAVADLTRAAELMDGSEDVEEPDGAPNRYDLPRSTLQTNVWYHLGLAHYLLGQYEVASYAYRRGLALAPNGDMLVATAHWAYLTHRRLGEERQAKKLVATIDPAEDVIENFAYRDALRLYRGEMVPREVLERHSGGLGLASAGYAVAAWRMANLDTARAQGLLERIAREASPASFGRMAAEADLARIQE